MTALYYALGISLVCFCLFVLMLLSAPQGFEDEGTGFHEGDE